MRESLIFVLSPDPTHRAVMDYLVSVKQLLRLHLSLGQLVSARQPSPSPSPASSLSQVCVCVHVYVCVCVRERERESVRES